MKRNPFARIAVILILTFVTPVMAEPVTPGVTVAPTRVEFKKDAKKAKLVVHNPSDKEQTYRVELLDLIMDDKGAFTETKEPVAGLSSIKPYVRFSPRSFTLQPQSSQTVRLQLNTPRDIPDAEYRSHLRVKALPKAEQPKMETDNKLAIVVNINYGVTVPVIYRKGDLDYTLAITRAKYAVKEGKPTVDVTITNNGNRSAYGDLRVRIDGSDKIAKFMPGTAIYLPLKERHYALVLDGEPASYASAKLVMEYIDRETGKVKATMNVAR